VKIITECAVFERKRNPPKVVFAEPSVRQIWSRNRVQSWTPTSPSMMFGSSTATLWILLSKVYDY